MTEARFATIGHSNRSRDEVILMLREAGVTALADVRAFLRSRANPAFNIDALPDALADAGILYRHFPALGGRRGKQADVDPSVNGFWRERGFHNYADYALGPEFTAGFAELLELGAKCRTALICAEAVWWRCHRRVITDYLLLSGHAVDHLMGPGQVMPARPSEGAVLREDGKVTYPAAP